MLGRRSSPIQMGFPTLCLVYNTAEEGNLELGNIFIQHFPARRHLSMKNLIQMEMRLRNRSFDGAFVKSNTIWISGNIAHLQYSANRTKYILPSNFTFRNKTRPTGIRSKIIENLLSKSVPLEIQKYFSLLFNDIPSWLFNGEAFLQTSPDKAGNRRVIDRRREFYFSSLDMPRTRAARFGQISIPPLVPLESLPSLPPSPSFWLTRGDALPKREGSQTISSIRADTRASLDFWITRCSFAVPLLVQRSFPSKRHVHRSPWRKWKIETIFKW